MENNETEYRDESHITEASDVDQSKVPSSIKTLSSWIRQKMYGEDVRESIARGIEKTSEVAQNAVNISNNTSSRQDNIEDRYDNQIAGNTDINEVIDARKPTNKPSYSTLGVRLDNMPSNEDIGNLDSLDISVDGGVREPFTSALETFKQTINNDSSILKIGLMQDLHYMRPIYDDEYGEAPKRGLQHIQHMGALSDRLDLVVWNGDNVHGREQKDATTNRIKQVVATSKMSFGDLPQLWTNGNHDDNNVYFSGQSKLDNTLTLKEMEQAYGVDKLYGYHDFIEQKIRVIVLDDFENPEIYNTDGSIKYDRSYNSVFGAEQVVWLANNALKVPVGYSVIVFTHCALAGFSHNTPFNKYTNVNHELVVGLLQAFNNGTGFTASGTNTDYPASVTADFTNQKSGGLIGVVCGHEHQDFAPQTIDGITLTVRTCNLGSGYQRVLDTVTEDAFDIIEIDTTNKHIKFNRFGWGNSVEYDY